ncbi:hypothetical protein WA026_018516 [Henosepilachna vigintioctopunctata]|uniref:Uncharacterized protein n=1 Tax=Henosepilachna vigintioctopunctata TaxID=420089 RepID=A0AAW1U396_9CUCU
MTEISEYIPQKLRYQPLKCLVLPWILVFLVIIYWFSLVPLLFAYYISSYAPTSIGKIIFLGCHFVIFVVILALLVFLWKISLRKERTKYVRPKINYYIFQELKKDDVVDEYSDSLKDWVEVRSSSIETRIKESPSQEVLLRTPKHFKLEDIADGRPFSQNLEVALTPRELFFIDLYENANKSRCTITRNFIQKEREFCSNFSRNVSSSELSCGSWEFESKVSKKDIEVMENGVPSDSISNTSRTEEVSEYFIANVSPKKSLTNEVFIFIQDESDILQKKG